MARKIELTAENLGATIKAVRTEKNITQTDLAIQCGLSEKTIRNVENGYGHSPKVEVVFSIFKALGIKVVLK